MDPILQNGVAAHSDRRGAKKSGPVPNGGIGADLDVAEDGGIWGNEVSLLEFGLLALIGQPSETGSQSVLVHRLTFDLVADFVELLTCGSESGANKVLGDVVQKFVKNYSHQLKIIIMFAINHLGRFGLFWILGV